ncbi:hypothetical protein NDU88_000172 [Pleurodeles waltl]|uniref:Uncharacterized protein n=1 Tax=Pleurodeles waltl TaxID=8319 RepID=A0AAV7L7K1_PLEWA|nr:hypothetical protein NDU88_000172 [Pleurodeles waltl]
MPSTLWTRQDTTGPPPGLSFTLRHLHSRLILLHAFRREEPSAPCDPQLLVIVTVHTAVSPAQVQSQTHHPPSSGCETPASPKEGAPAPLEDGS